MVEIETGSGAAVAVDPITVGLDDSHQMQSHSEIDESVGEA